MTVKQPATLLVAAGAMLIGAIGAAAPAQAADAFVALSYSLESKVAGMAVDATENAAKPVRSTAVWPTVAITA